MRAEANESGGGTALALASTYAKPRRGPVDAAFRLAFARALALYSVQRTFQKGLMKTNPVWVVLRCPVKAIREMVKPT
jgi:hypothetical protein